MLWEWLVLLDDVGEMKTDSVCVFGVELSRFTTEDKVITLGSKSDGYFSTNENKRKHVAILSKCSNVGTIWRQPVQ